MPRMARPQLHGSWIECQVLLGAGAAQGHAEKVPFLAVALCDDIVDGSQVETRLWKLLQGCSAELGVDHLAREAFHSSAKAVRDADGLADAQDAGGTGCSNFAHGVAKDH